MCEILIHSTTRGLIFDLDGTIADTMPAHFQAWKQTCEPYGINFTKELFMQLAGIPLYQTVEKLNQIFGTNMDPQKVGNEKEELFMSTLSQTKVIEPIAEIIRNYHGRLPMAVGTGGQRSVAKETLKVVEMDKYFDIIVSSDDITHPKPHPETFLSCAEQMGIPPHQCQVFEDGILGMQAAREAGMQVTDVNQYYKTVLV
ncbi:HAD family hydrolase [Thermophagus xiamenensis]|uniref:Haloacid dehalogenase superfamily, subfamily IA, variant 3 with third motif having DD or ED/beta-phosphoglucomutase family hydrolase n=1 Tax=Thermophagus xiamenensis TaxID=385682 RepID=A0A1I1ZXP3_9BACT|nr:beta-phosphoglucomutase family hydrolase [Thermophagus xiamenensis]SFE35250.1 haloacid dehalogenase superfamily, subfamily IA, variant 3 with third motif having DD or ED/beta-phosphoglucomutase family hydrolase [Thermophagus xiamenensis]